MTKYSKHVVLTAFAALLVLVFTGCNKHDNTPLAAPGTTSAEEFVSMDPEALPSIVEDGTLAEPMKHRHPDTDRRMRAFKIFRCLELTDAQMELVKGFLSGHRDCVGPVIDSLRASEKPLLEAARAARQEVIAKYKAGEITREEAREQLSAIHARLREALQNNPVKAWAKEALENCRNGLMRQIRSVLTEEQQAMWDEWIATGKLPCDEGRPHDGDKRPHGDDKRPHDDDKRPRGPGG